MGRAVEKYFSGTVSCSVLEIRSVDVSRRPQGRAQEQGSVLVHKTVKYADSLERSAWVCLD